MSETKPSKPTVKDVARAAGVSPMTVSNVINSTGRVGAETATRVREVIEQIGYRQSVAARRLRLAKQWTIGLLVVDENPNFLSDPFTTVVITGLTNYLTEIGYSLTIRAIKPSQFKTAQLFQGTQADGIVVLLSGTETERRWLVEELLTFQVPIVVLQDSAIGKSGDIAVVRQDDFDGGRQVADHLVASGARHFWVLAPATIWPAMQAREAGFRRQVAAIRDATVETLICGDESYDVTFRVTQAALAERRKPDAIVGLNDQMAIGAMRACQSKGHAVPDDIQITGFNGFEFWKLVDPVMTTVLSSAQEVGRQAGRVLIEALEEGGFTERETVLPVKFLPGKSSKGASPRKKT